MAPAAAPMLPGMAVSGTVPARSAPRRFDPANAARWLRRATWMLFIVAVFWVFTSFDTQWVPAGMDTVPSAPAGSWCILDRRQGSVRPGSDVFLEPPGGGLLLSRITELDAETFAVQHPNAEAAWPDSRTFGRLPRRHLRGMVAAAFPPTGTNGPLKGATVPPQGAAGSGR